MARRFQNCFGGHGPRSPKLPSNSVVRTSRVIQPPASSITVDRRPCGELHEEREEHAVAVEVLEVPFVKGVLASVAPVAFLLRDAPQDHRIRVEERLGDVSFDRRWWAVADIHPDESDALFDRIGLDARSTTDRRFRTVRQHRLQSPGAEVERPAVVGAAPGAGKLAPAACQRHAAMRASIRESHGRGHCPGSARYRRSGAWRRRVCLDRRRDQINRIPIVAKTGRRLVVSPPRAGARLRRARACFGIDLGHCRFPLGRGC